MDASTPVVGRLPLQRDQAVAAVVQPGPPVERSVHILVGQPWLSSSISALLPHGPEGEVAHGTQASRRQPYEEAVTGTSRGRLRITAPSGQRTTRNSSWVSSKMATCPNR